MLAAIVASQCDHVEAFDWDLASSITNPTPETIDYFGSALDWLDDDLILIGAFQANVGPILTGEAYLFLTDGTLVTTFTNPTPEYYERMGSFVASVGGKKVLIGAQNANASVEETGEAYLFDTNGTLLSAFTNPTPETNDDFGESVSSLGPNMVLIGANRDNTAGTKTGGSAYVLSTDGSLLATITNPCPEVDALFGYSVAGADSGKLLVGAWTSDIGAQATGAAYVYDVTGPTIRLAPTFSNSLSLSWEADLTGFSLQEAIALSPLSWPNSASGTNNPATVPISHGAQLYRLTRR